MEHRSSRKRPEGIPRCQSSMWRDRGYLVGQVVTEPYISVVFDPYVLYQSIAVVTLPLLFFVIIALVLVFTTIVLSLPNSLILFLSLAFCFQPLPFERFSGLLVFSELADSGLIPHNFLGGFLCKAKLQFFQLVRLPQYKEFPRCGHGQPTFIRGAHQ